jgi:hypothetical protein
MNPATNWSLSPEEMEIIFGENNKIDKTELKFGTTDVNGKPIDANWPQQLIDREL